ncbi:MAG: hypothetical protein LUF87_05840 [Alistipes sp.]|nr:hypothetical protein [Alistipes sp.]
MKKLIMLLFASASVLQPLAAQGDIDEPQFAGEGYLVLSGAQAVKLEKSIPQFQTKAGAGVYLAGIGKVHTKLTIPGCCSAIRTAAGPVTLIVKAVDNVSDPMSIVSVFRMEQKKKQRKAELSSANAFKGNSSNNLQYIMFEAEKYGESSYLLFIDNLPAGEYGVIVSNPNALDERATIVSTFGVD